MFPPGPPSVDAGASAKKKIFDQLSNNANITISRVHQHIVPPPPAINYSIFLFGISPRTAITLLEQTK